MPHHHFCWNRNLLFISRSKCRTFEFLPSKHSHSRLKRKGHQNFFYPLNFILQNCLQETGMAACCNCCAILNWTGCCLSVLAGPQSFSLSHKHRCQRRCGLPTPVWWDGPCPAQPCPCGAALVCTSLQETVGSEGPLLSSRKAFHSSEITSCYFILSKLCFLNKLEK